MSRVKNKKRALCALLCFFIMIGCAAWGFFSGGTSVSAAEYWPEGPEIESPSVVLMELNTGTVLYEKEGGQKNYPASITKILTTLIALENSNMDEIVEFSRDAIDKTEGSGIARDYGEQMTMEQCLYAVMLASANECAYAVAEHVAGSVDEFVKMMNERAKKIGCLNTHFSNPHGLFDENHYTTAYDMALIAREAYKNETFRIITGTARYTIPPTNKHDEPTDLQNHNELLYPWQRNCQYEYCTGGKTGYTDVARSTLVEFAEKDGMGLVCVIMHTESPSHWTDSRALLDFGFESFQIYNIADNEATFKDMDISETGVLNNNKSFVRLDPDACVVLPATIIFTDAAVTLSYERVSKNVVGTLKYTYAGREIGEADIEKTDSKVQGFKFGSVKNGGDGTPQGSEPVTFSVTPQMVGGLLFAVGILLILIVVGKYLMDNYYIMKHNREVKRLRRAEYKALKNRNKNKGRRRRWM